MQHQQTLPQAPQNPFSFINLLPVITIAVLKAVDEFSTMLLLRTEPIEGEINRVLLDGYSAGPVSHLLIWALYVGLFSSVYIGLQMVPAPVKARRLMMLTWTFTVVVVLLNAVIGNLTY